MAKWSFFLDFLTWAGSLIRVAHVSLMMVKLINSPTLVLIK